MRDLDGQETKQLAQDRVHRLRKQSLIFLLKNKGRLVALALLAAFLLILGFIYRLLAFFISDYGAIVILITCFGLLLRGALRPAPFEPFFRRLSLTQEIDGDLQALLLVAVTGGEEPRSIDILEIPRTRRSQCGAARTRGEMRG